MSSSTTNKQQTSSTEGENSRTMKAPLHQNQQQQQQECSSNDNLLESAMKSIFGTCIGAVDMASYMIQNTCGGNEEVNNNKAGTAGDNAVPVLKLRKPVPNSAHVKRRQGDTLEFPANWNGVFDDDVSAISALTLEEMEKLQIFRKQNNIHVNPKNGRTKTPPMTSKTLSKKKNAIQKSNNISKDWAYEMKRPPSAASSADPSLGVSTSGSASSGDAEQPPRLTPKDSKNKNNGMTPKTKNTKSSRSPRMVIDM